MTMAVYVIVGPFTPVKLAGKLYAVFFRILYDRIYHLMDVL